MHHLVDQGSDLVKNCILKKLARFLRKFLGEVLRELLHGEHFFCLNFLQKEMSAVFAQETC